MPQRRVISIAVLGVVCSAGDHLAADIGALEEVAASSPSSKFNSAKGAPEA